MNKFIVYQFGKVASTSIVNSLNDLNDVEAYQSHFLGRKAFVAILDNLMNPNVLPYFFHHSSGQLISNLRLMRLVNKHQSIPGINDKLIFLSLSRSPMEWFRSSIAQDVEGYLPKFVAMLNRNDIEVASDGEVVTASLDIIFEKICETIELLGGIDNYTFGSRDLIKEKMNFTSPFDFNEFMSFFSLFMRPFKWFDSHFLDFSGYSLNDLDEMGSHCFVKINAWTSFYVFRYEDLSVSLPLVLKDCEIEAKFALKQENVSSTKAFSQEITDSFSTSHALRLRALTDSKYCRFFGYVD